MNSIEQHKTALKIDDWGLTDYWVAFDRQTEMVAARLAGSGDDTLVFVEHPTTVTLGRRATEEDLLFPEKTFSERGVTLKKINRGGLATAHEPGQLVVYPIVQLKKNDLRWFANLFLQVVISVLADYGVAGYLKEGEPGVWVNGCKICSFGIALKKWISSHGIALNINNSLETFDMIVTCGRPDEVVTSLGRELNRTVDMAEVKKNFTKHFCKAFGYEITMVAAKNNS